MDCEEVYDKLYRYCYFKLRNRQLAEDVTQESFLRWVDHGQRGGEGYLYTIARNLCTDHWRKHQPEPLSEELIQPGPEEDVILRTDLQRAMETLTKEEQELLLLRWADQLPVGMIAKLMGISRFAVYRRTERALKQLREQWGKEQWG